MDSMHNKYFPPVRIRINQRRSFKPWLNKGLRNAINKKNALYKHSLISKTSSSTIKYKQYKNKLTTILREAEKKYYADKLSAVHNNLSKTWKIINTLLCRHNSTVKIKEIISNGIVINNSKMVSNIFNSFFTSVGPDLARAIPVSSVKPEVFLKGNYSSSFFFNPTNEMEIFDIISNLKNGASAGADNFPIGLLKFCSKELMNILVDINNHSMCLGVFPDMMKIARIIPIHKAGDKTIVSNYRPISILSVFSKITEKIVHQRLVNYLDANTILHGNQFGFRQELSTEMALLQMIEEISKSLDEKNITFGDFVDLAKAFDTVEC